MYLNVINVLLSETSKLINKIVGYHLNILEFT